jgi:hypothetical protein
MDATGMAKLFEKVARHDESGWRFEEYRTSRYRDLLAPLQNRKVVYLDLKYWIALREATETPATSKATNLLDRIRAGVTNGTLICPVSYAVFNEVRKIGNFEKRLRQATLMDEFSLGLGLRNPFDTAEIEYTQFFHRVSSTLRQIPLRAESVFCPVGLMIGEHIVSHPGLGEHSLEHANKVMFEANCQRTMRDLVTTFAPLPYREEGAANLINIERAKFPREGKSFSLLFRDELHGLFESMLPQVERIFRGFATILGNVGADQITFSPKHHTFWINCLREACTSGKAGGDLASQRIEAAIHAAIRMDDHRKYKPNDLHDLRHASVAAAYCDLFFTERSLCELLNRTQVRAVIPKAAVVVSSLEQAIACLIL